jgi:fumarate reductase flavoprotein subunit
MKARHWFFPLLTVVLIAGYLLIGFISGGYAAGTTPTKAFSALGHFHEQKNITCIKCHNSATPTAAASSMTCLKCHGNAEGKFIGTDRKFTFDGGVTVNANPHQSHLVELPCTECHKMHVASVNYCNQCHLISDMHVK